MLRSSGGAVLGLAGLLAGLGILTSRLGLVAHELVGHGATAVALGGRVLDVRLFWLAGGWVRYRLDDPAPAAAIAVAAGGIAVEAVLGGGLWLLLARRAGAAARLARGAGAALLVHAAWYLAAGTWHGFGDGALLYHELGAARAPIALAAGAAAVAMAYAGARAVLGVIAALVPGGRRARIAGAAAAVLLAGALQVLLAAGEVRLRRDAIYGQIMQREGDRLVERELAAWQRAQAARGLEVSAAARAARERELAAAHRELPFAHALAVLTAAGIAAGARRARPAPAGIAAPASGALIGAACAAAAGSVLLVIALDALFV